MIHPSTRKMALALVLLFSFLALSCGESEIYNNAGGGGGATPLNLDKISFGFDPEAAGQANDQYFGGDEVILTPWTKVVPAAAADQLELREDSIFVPASVADDLPPLEALDIIATSSETTPFLRRVRSISESNGAITIQTSPAHPSEAIWEGSMEMTYLNSSAPNQLVPMSGEDCSVVTPEDLPVLAPRFNMDEDAQPVENTGEDGGDWTAPDLSNGTFEGEVSIFQMTPYMRTCGFYHFSSEYDGWRSSDYYETVGEASRPNYDEYVSNLSCSSTGECQIGEECARPNGEVWWSDDSDTMYCIQKYGRIYEDSIYGDDGIPTCSTIIRSAKTIREAGCGSDMEEIWGYSNSDFVGLTQPVDLSPYFDNRGVEDVQLPSETEEMAELKHRTDAYLTLRRAISLEFLSEQLGREATKKDRADEILKVLFFEDGRSPESLRGDELPQILALLSMIQEITEEIYEPGCTQIFRRDDIHLPSKAQYSWAQGWCNAEERHEELDFKVESIEVGYKDVFVGFAGSGSYGYPIVDPDNPESTPVPDALEEKLSVKRLINVPVGPIQVPVSLKVTLKVMVELAFEGQIGAHMSPLAVKFDELDLTGGHHKYANPIAARDANYAELVREEDKRRYDQMDIGEVAQDGFGWGQTWRNREVETRDLANEVPVEPSGGTTEVGETGVEISLKMPRIIDSDDPTAKVVTSPEDILAADAKVSLGFEIIPEFQMLIADAVGAVFNPITIYGKVEVDSASPYCHFSSKVGARSKLGIRGQLPYFDLGIQGTIPIFDTCGGTVCEDSLSNYFCAEACIAGDSCDTYQPPEDPTHVKLTVVGHPDLYQSPPTGAPGSSPEEKAEIQGLWVQRALEDNFFPVDITVDASSSIDSIEATDKLTTVVGRHSVSEPAGEFVCDADPNWEETTVGFESELIAEFNQPLEPNDRVRIHRPFDETVEDGNLYLCRAGGYIQVQVGDGDNWGLPATGPGNVTLENGDTGSGFIAPDVDVTLTEDCGFGGELEVDQACLLY